MYIYDYEQEKYVYSKLPLFNRKGIVDHELNDFYSKQLSEEVKEFLLNVFEDNKR